MADDAIDRDELIQLFRSMDAQQQCTDNEGGREVAWYYWREGFEELLGLEHDALDTAADGSNPCDQVDE